MSKIESSEFFYAVGPQCGGWVAQVRATGHEEAVTAAFEAMADCTCDFTSLRLLGGKNMGKRMLLAWSFPGRGCNGNGLTT